MNIMHVLNILAIVLMLTIIIRLIFQSLQGFLVQKLGQQITADIRNDLFKHVLSLGVRFFDNTPFHHPSTQVYIHASLLLWGLRNGSFSIP